MNFPSCCRVRGLELESNAETTQPNSCGLSNSSKSMAGGFFHATLSLHNFSNLKSKTFECFECSTTLVGGFKHFYLFFNFHTYLGKIPILANIFFRWVVETTNMYFFHKKSVIYIYIDPMVFCFVQRPGYWAALSSWIIQQKWQKFSHGEN